MEIDQVKRIITKNGSSECIRVNFRVKNEGKLPQVVRWDFQSYRVRLYHPLPLRCYNCQQYGHGVSTCKNRKVCGGCGEAHLFKDCKKANPPKCFHCKLGHLTGNRRCKYGIEAQQIEDQKAAGNITYDQYITQYKSLNDSIRGSNDRTEKNKNKDETRANNSVYTGQALKTTSSSSSQVNKNSPTFTWANVVSGTTAVTSEETTNLQSKHTTPQTVGPILPPETDLPTTTEQTRTEITTEAVHTSNTANRSSKTNSVQQTENNVENSLKMSFSEIIVTIIPEILLIVTDKSLTSFETFIKLGKVIVDTISSYFKQQ